MMRTRVSVVWWLAAVLALGACSFNPTRPCSSDADCTRGGACDPGTKTCVAAGDPNDKTAPTFVVVVSTPPAREDFLNLKVLDPGAAGAFRRDDVVRVTVISDDRDVLLASVTLTARGVVASGADSGIGLPFGPCGPSSPGAGRAFCIETEVPLGPPIPLAAFRGVFQFTASGADRSGNVATPATMSIPVTRWRWRYTAGLPIRTTPAIADDGTVVFGTSNGTTGSLVALTPEGAPKWPAIALGPIEASPAIGEFKGGQQLAYVGTAARPSTLYAVSLADGSPAGSCLGSTNTKPGGEMWGSPAISRTTGVNGVYESATLLASGQQLVILRPSPVPPDPACVFAPSAAQQVSSSSAVATDDVLFLGTTEGAVRAFIFDSGTWVRNMAWGAGVGSVAIGDTSIGPLALMNRVIGTTRLRGAFMLDPTSGGLLESFPDGGVASDPSGPSLSSSGVLFADGASPSPAIFSANRDLTNPSSVPLPGAGSVSTIALGSAGLRYLLTLDGHIEAHLPALTLDWSAALDASSFEASPTIDCFRDGGAPSPAVTGVLYAASTSGNLYSVVVDDRGLDPAAPWPKYQHDIRNTGNPGTALLACP